MNKKTIGSAAAAFLLSTGAAAAFFTQPSTTFAADAAVEQEASINGIIVDTAGQPVAGVVLEWGFPEGASFRTMTAPDGMFRIVSFTGTRDASIKLLSPVSMAFKSHTGALGGTLSERSITGIVYDGKTFIEGIKIVADTAAGLKPVEYVREVNRPYTLQPIADLALPKNKRLGDDLSPAEMWSNKTLVAGRVEDGKGNVVGRVIVRLVQVNGSTTWTQRQVSAVDGEFRFGDIPFGNYKLIVEGPDGIKVSKMTPSAGAGTVSAPGTGFAIIGAAPGESIENISIRPATIYKGTVVTVDLSGVK